MASLHGMMFGGHVLRYLLDVQCASRTTSTCPREEGRGATFSYLVLCAAAAAAGSHPSRGAYICTTRAQKWACSRRCTTDFEANVKPLLLDLMVALGA